MKLNINYYAVTLLNYLRTSVVYWESKGWPTTADCCWSSSSEFCWIAVLCRCNAFFRNAGQADSRCGQADQNHRGIRPVGAVDTIYPRARGCCNKVPTSSCISAFCNIKRFYHSTFQIIFAERIFFFAKWTTTKYYLICDLLFLNFNDLTNLKTYLYSNNCNWNIYKKTKLGKAKEIYYLISFETYPWRTGVREWTMVIISSCNTWTSRLWGVSTSPSTSTRTPHSSGFCFSFRPCTEDVVEVTHIIRHVFIKNVK